LYFYTPFKKDIDFIMSFIFSFDKIFYGKIKPIFCAIVDGYNSLPSKVWNAPDNAESNNASSRIPSKPPVAFRLRREIYQHLIIIDIFFNCFYFSIITLVFYENLMFVCSLLHYSLCCYS